MNAAASPRENGFARERRRVLAAWIVLIVLMLASLASAHLALGPWNAVAGLVIATIKAAIVLWLFMRLRSASALVRIVAAAGFAIWLLLIGLSGVDYATRPDEPAQWQSPQQLRPVLRPLSRAGEGDSSRSICPHRAPLGGNMPSHHSLAVAITTSSACGSPFSNACA